MLRGAHHLLHPCVESERVGTNLSSHSACQFCMGLAPTSALSWLWRCGTFWHFPGSVCLHLLPWVRSFIESVLLERACLGLETVETFKIQMACRYSFSWCDNTTEAPWPPVFCEDWKVKGASLGKRSWEASCIHNYAFSASDLVGIAGEKIKDCMWSYHIGINSQYFTLYCIWHRDFIQLVLYSGGPLSEEFVKMFATESWAFWIELIRQPQTTESSFHGCRKLTAYYTQNQRPPLTEAVFLTRLPRLHGHQTDLCRVFSHGQPRWWVRDAAPKTLG